MKLRFSRKASPAGESSSGSETDHSSGSNNCVRFHRPSYQIPNRPRRICNDMLETPIQLEPIDHDDDDIWQGMGVTDIALLMSSVARFVEIELCTGITAKTTKEYPLMRKLVDRLLNYGWPLVSPTSTTQLELPGQENTLKAEDAVETMENLAGFFERRAEASTSDSTKDLLIANGLKQAAMLTGTTLLELSRASIVGEWPYEAERAAAAGALPMPTIVVEGDSSSEDEFEDAFEDQFDDTCQDAQEISLFPHENMEPSSSHEVETYLLPPPRSSSLRRSRAIDNWQPALETVEEGDACVVASAPQIAHRPDADDHHPLEQSQPQPTTLEIPHELLGRRHVSRSWFENDSRFAEIVGQVEQWTDDNPGYDYTTIQGRRDLEEFAEHYCNAEPLGISALFIIKCEHPLDPEVVSLLDVDILRFVRIVLWDWTNGHPEREAELESLEIVRKEIKARKEEFAQLDEAEQGLVLPTYLPVAAPAWEPPTTKAIEGGDYPEESADCNSDAASTVENVVLTPSWLNWQNDLPEDEEPTLHTAKAQTVVPVAQPIECNNLESMEDQLREKPLPEVPYIYDGERFTTLMRRATLRGLGIGTDSTGAPIHSSMAPRNVRLECHNARLHIQNDSLRHRIAALEAEIDLLRPLDDPPKGSRTDDTKPHPLQHLVGQQPRHPTCSMEAAVDSASNRALNPDDDLHRHASGNLMSLAEFLKTEPPPQSSASSSSGDSSTGSWYDVIMWNWNRGKKKKNSPPGAICDLIPRPKHRPIVYEGMEGVPRTYVPSSKGKGKGIA